MSNKTDILALLPDNTTGEITPQKLRDSFDKVDPEQQTPPQESELAGAAPKMKMSVAKPAGVGAEMEVKYGNTVVASMQWNKINQEFTFNLFDKDTGASKAGFEIKPDGNAYIGNEQVATEKMIREFRHTVVMDTADHNKATRAEAITAFKQLPHFDWKKDDQFYIKDVTGAKMISMKYFADGATNEATAGRFYYRAMAECS